MELWLELTTDVLTYLQKSLTPKKKTDDGDSQPRDVPSPKRKRRKHIVRSPKRGSKKSRTMEHPPEERAEPAED